MNELKVIKVAEIRKKLSCIPGKLLLAVLAVIGINWEESLSYALTAIILKPVAKLIPGLSPTVLELLDTTPTDAIINAGQLDLSGNSDVLNRIFANPLPAIIELILIYGIISFFYFFIKLIGNWMVGLIAGLSVVVLTYNLGSSLEPDYQMIILGIMLFGGPILDLLNFLRYVTLKNDVIRYHEQRAEEAYGDGYDRGFEKGYRKALRENDDYRYERLDQRSRRRLSHTDDYDDYPEDYDASEYNNYQEDYDYYEEELGYDDYDSIEDKNSGHSTSGQGYFSDCKDTAAIKKRYRDLCKVYHPDSGNGSVEIFQMITEEYNRIMK